MPNDIAEIEKSLRWIRDELELPHPHGEGLVGNHVAERLRAAGADELLAEAERLVAAG